MIHQQIERLVLDVVMSNANDEVVRDLHSGVAVLEVDHLTMTYIVLALEHRLGIELPTHLEDARTVAELVAGVIEALRIKADMKYQVALECVPTQSLTFAPNSNLRLNGVRSLRSSRQRRKKPIHRGTRIQ